MANLHSQSFTCSSYPESTPTIQWATEWLDINIGPVILALGSKNGLYPRELSTFVHTEAPQTSQTNQGSYSRAIPHRSRKMDSKDQVQLRLGRSTRKRRTDAKDESASKRMKIQEAKPTSPLKQPYVSRWNMIAHRALLDGIDDGSKMDLPRLTRHYQRYFESAIEQYKSDTEDALREIVERYLWEKYWGPEASNPFPEPSPEDKDQITLYPMVADEYLTKYHSMLYKIRTAALKNGKRTSEQLFRRMYTDIFASEVEEHKKYGEPGAEVQYRVESAIWNAIHGSDRVPFPTSGCY